jgi:sugar/nucleoside kinase (ribokinase family)
MSKYDVVVLGDVNMDYVVAQKLSFPLSSLVKNGLIYWEEIDEKPGGSGLNFCVFATKAGYRSLMLGKTGNDTAGKFIMHWLKSQGVTIPRGWISELPTGKALIVRDSAGIRLLINNKKNANHTLSTADIEAFQKEITSCRVLYISGYCINEPQAARYQASIQAMAYAKATPQPPTVVFDLVPHFIYEKFSFEQLRACIRHVDILISEVATMRRFLGLGNKKEKTDEAMARDIAERIRAFYPRLMLRFGPSGCDNEVLVDQQTGSFLSRETGHSKADDTRGFGDRLALSALRDFFHVLPAT